MGMNWKAFAHIALNVAPYVLMLVPGIPPNIARVAGQAIGEAQKIEGASGPDKKAHVMNIAAGAGATPAELSALDNGIDTAVAVIKTIHDVHGSDIAKVLPATPASPGA
jgi:hypothetical protein